MVCYPAVMLVDHLRDLQSLYEQQYSEYLRQKAQPTELQVVGERSVVLEREVAEQASIVQRLKQEITELKAEQERLRQEAAEEVVDRYKASEEMKLQMDEYAKASFEAGFNVFHQRVLRHYPELIEVLQG
ncbi:PREDICTED: uncharacterized protein LOC109114780 isoform X2 [Nelumbo nucifera]|uniref:Uncharacterized protein LOC109114780 isoform X2 n=1 Tax=Nelumbo nucifera TaxID=4432 RepID=A0A1U8Q603_NELNU|nr:PREDICTED: uncharacterized protein LOC109114780 isoform X2 [Nelumbo nucifera]